MTPSVGRIVHYVSRGSADGKYQPKCRAAIVTEVCFDGTLDLAVLNPQGLFFDLAVSESDHEHYGGSWHWPERIE